MFLGTTTPHPRDTRWMILVRWLQAVQNSATGLVFFANNPGKRDTTWVLKQKINAALQGVSYLS